MSLKDAIDAARPVEPEYARPPPFTDEALALRFAETHEDDLRYAETHEDDLRYVAKWSNWLLYDGTVWASDDTLRAFDLSRVICREASAECNAKKTAQAVASAKTVAAVGRLAKADRRLAATVAQWDQDDFLLNTINGDDDER